VQPFNPSLAAVAAAHPGYRQIDCIGSGGQKVVYRAERADGMRVALKLIQRTIGDQNERAIREVQAAAQLDGPHFARIFEVGTCNVGTAPCIYIVEEFLDGDSLRQRLAAGPQPLAFARSIGEALLDALDQVEGRRLVHRDIKPENIMLTRDGRVVLIDFGIARHLDAVSLTSSYAMFGPMTIGYCAPEQVTNQKRAISIRTDLFAVGIVLYEIVRGRNPFVDGCTDASQVLTRCLQYQPPALTWVPPGLGSFVQQCLEKSPHRRPASVARARDIFDAVQWR
jgi:eukaryotic-like serine/threonine-protein kinase